MVTKDTNRNIKKKTIKSTSKSVNLLPTMEGRRPKRPPVSDNYIKLTPDTHLIYHLLSLVHDVNYNLGGWEIYELQVLSETINNYKRKGLFLDLLKDTAGTFKNLSQACDATLESLLQTFFLSLLYSTTYDPYLMNDPLYDELTPLLKEKKLDIFLLTADELRTFPKNLRKKILEFYLKHIFRYIQQIDGLKYY